MDLKNTMNIKNFNIDQPIVLSDVKNVIYATNGVLSVDKIQFETVAGNFETRTYNDSQFDVAGNTSKGILFPSSGGMFEIKYPDSDIVGRAI